MWSNPHDPQFPADLVTFTEEVLNGKLNLLCNWHYMKSVGIWSFSGQYFPAFGLNTERYGVSHRIQSECGKIWTRKTPNTDTFDAVRCRDTNNLPHNDVSEYKRILFFNLEILILANVNFLVITDFARVQIYYYNKPISIIYVW